jgi:hypothetical protein
MRFRRSQLYHTQTHKKTPLICFQKKKKKKKVDAAMGALTSDAEVGVLCDACDHLAVVLGKLPSLASSRRATPVLRSLFRFLDMKDPRLLLKLVRLVLMVWTYDLSYLLFFYLQCCYS